MKHFFVKARNSVSTVLDAESKTLFKNSSWIFTANFIGFAFAFLRSVIVARGLGAETFGAYVIVVAFVGIVQEFLNLNAGTAIIKFGAAYQAEQRIDKLTALIKAALKATAIMVIISVAVIALLSFVTYSVFIPTPGLRTFIILYGLAASTRYFNSISQGILRLFYKFRLNSLIQIAMDIVESSLLILIVWLYPGNLTLFFIVAISACFLNSILCNGMAYWELRKVFKPFFKAKLDLIKEEVRSVRQFVLGNSLANSLKSLMSQGDILLLGALAGPAHVAFYSIAKKLGYSILVLTDPLMNSIYPQFSKLLAEKKYTEIKSMLRKITSLSLIPSVIFLCVAYFLNEWIIVTIFGQEYAEAGFPFFWLLAGAIFGSITFWTLPLIQSLGLIQLRLKIYSIAIVTGLAIAMLAIPLWQATGMAIAILCTNVLINVTFILEANKKMHVSGAVIA